MAKKVLAAKPTSSLLPKWEAPASRQLNIEVTSVQVRVANLGDAIRNTMFWDDALVKLWVAEADRAKVALDDLVFKIHDHVTANKP